MSDTVEKIFVVDDDPSVRESLSMLLSSAGYHVEAFTSASDFLASEGLETDDACLILDVKMPQLSGLELQTELASRSCSIPIIFITGHGDISMGVHAMKRGAVNFLTKPFDDEELLQTVKEALEMSSQSRMEQELQFKIESKLLLLTERETEVLPYLIGGWLNKNIGFALDISERTVKAHRKRILEKMEVGSIADLVRLTEKAGVKPISPADN